MSEQERKHRVLLAVLNAVEPFIRWRRERKQCPACGQQMDDLVPYGRVCLTSRCDAYRGNYAAARLHGRPDWSRSTWVLETISKALFVSFALAFFGVILNVLTALVGVPLLSPDSTLAMAALGWFMLGAAIGLLRHPLFGSLLVIPLAAIGAGLYLVYRRVERARA